MKLYSILLLIAIVFASCDEYLDEMPSKTTKVVPETVEDLYILLNDHYGLPAEWNDNLIYCSDDFGLYTDLYDKFDKYYWGYAPHFATWDVKSTPENSRSHWFQEWKKIFTANLIIENLDNVKGDEEEKNNLRAEACLIRAYGYYQMAMTYCLPYTEETKGEMGLPIKKSTAFDESLKRESLEDTWNMILSDLDEALKIDKELKVIDGIKQSWRGSNVAVRAFAARVHLTLGNYDKALSYANEALSLKDEFIDYNTEMRFADASWWNAPVWNGTEKEQLDFPVTGGYYYSDYLPLLNYKETYYLRLLQGNYRNFLPSSELLNSYNQEYDLRYKYHIVENYSLKVGAYDPLVRYPGYIFFYTFWIPSGPSVPEALLIKAEAQVRLGQWQEGITTVNRLRAVRMDNMAPIEVINLTASSQTEALTKVLAERRRELPFAHRWFDIKRYNFNNDPSDDVSITRTFYPYDGLTVEYTKEPITYKIEGKDRRFAAPIPNAEIEKSIGVIEQNTY